MVRAGAEDPARLAARLGGRASSIVVDAEVAARAAGLGFAPHCPVLVVPPVLAAAGPDAEVWVDAGGCASCSVTLGFAHAYADRVGAPLRVGLRGGPAEPDALHARAWLARFALCYPGLRVTVHEGPWRAARSGRPRLLVAGLPEPGLRDRPRPRLPRAGRPVALVPVAA